MVVDHSLGLLPPTLEDITDGEDPRVGLPQVHVEVAVDAVAARPNETHGNFIAWRVLSQYPRGDDGGESNCG